MFKNYLGIFTYFLLLILGAIYILSLKNWNIDYIYDALLFAIITSIVGSIAFLLLLWMLKPQIEISNSIALHKDEEGGDLYYFKFINESRIFDLYNIDVFLFLVSVESGGGGINTRSRPLTHSLYNRKINHIPKKRSNDELARFANIFSTEHDLSGYLEKKNMFLEVQIIANHSLSGYYRIFTKKYSGLSSIQNGEFKHGNSTDIV